ncbi:MAG: hypothetical protein WBW32_05950 [Luteibacter sp.]
MSFGPFDVRLVTERLRVLELGDPSAAGNPDAQLRKVGVAADYAAVKSLRDFPAPCVYVLLAREQFEPRAPTFGQRGQQVPGVQSGVVQIGVVLAARNYREEGGAQLTDEFQALLGSLRSRLMGWVPDCPGAKPLQLVQGDLLQYDNATALWCDVWMTKTNIGAEAQ